MGQTLAFYFVGAFYFLRWPTHQVNWQRWWDQQYSLVLAVGETIYCVQIRERFDGRLLARKKNAGAWRPTVARWRVPDVILFLYLSIVFCLGFPILPYDMQCCPSPDQHVLKVPSWLGQVPWTKAPSPTLMKKMTFGNLHPYVLRSSGKTLGLAAKKMLSSGWN